MMNARESSPLLVICGPTASGKTALAVELARYYPIEVVSADSRQVYRGMDIGTAKATAEERHRVPHHLLDLVEADEEFSVADFIRLAHPAIAAIHRRGKVPVLLGGTGLYLRGVTEGLVAAPAGNPALRAELLERERREGGGTLYRLLRELDPPLAGRIQPGDLTRTVRALEVFRLSGRRLSDFQREHAFAERPYVTLKIALAPPREELYRRIDRRVELMLEQGLAAEVRGLLERGCDPESKALRTIGYREMICHLRGAISLAEATALIQRNSRHYAKRQLTWFRGDEAIIWVDSCSESANILKLIELFLLRTRSGYG
ncbi:MAG: tRNA (adenosine(37)-N6)-dimethylallyltransferase MiaA [Trichloromonas sp.]|nr:tRNA (adenosine(37)-N6)-dimethylallyltransferase MiaA [Trichloromonas sp.]